MVFHIECDAYGHVSTYAQYKIICHALHLMFYEKHWNYAFFLQIARISTSRPNKHRYMFNHYTFLVATNIDISLCSRGTPLLLQEELKTCTKCRWIYQCLEINYEYVVPCIILALFEGIPQIIVMVHTLTGTSILSCACHLTTVLMHTLQCTLLLGLPLNNKIIPRLASISSRELSKFSWAAHQLREVPPLSALSPVGSHSSGEWWSQIPWHLLRDSWSSLLLPSVMRNYLFLFKPFNICQWGPTASDWCRVRYWRFSLIWYSRKRDRKSVVLFWSSFHYVRKLIELLLIMESGSVSSALLQMVEKKKHITAANA